MLSARVSGFRSDPVDVSGVAIEPALGLPRAAVYYSVWPRWFEILLGLASAAIFVAALTHTIDIAESSVDSKALLIMFAGLSPFLVIDGVRSLRMRPGVIVVSNGFLYQTSFRTPGPVFWQEVESLRVGRKRTGRRTFPALYISVKAGAYPANLSGRPGKRPLSLTIPMDHGNDKYIVPAIFGTHQQWLESQARQT